MTQAGTARHLGVTEAAVGKWKRQLLEEGSQSRKATGRPPKLDNIAKAELVKNLEEGAVAAGFLTEQWTQARVKKLIEREFGVVYHQNYISRLSDDLGWCVQKMDPRAMERDEELFHARPRRGWPRVKKRGGSAQRPCLKMNLDIPMQNRSVLPWRRKAKPRN